MGGNAGSIGVGAIVLAGRMVGFNALRAPSRSDDGRGLVGAGRWNVVRFCVRTLALGCRKPRTRRDANFWDDHQRALLDCRTATALAARSVFALRFA